MNEARQSSYVERMLVLLGCGLLALGMVVALSWFMHSLVRTGQLELSETSRQQILDFVRIKRSEVSQRKDRKPPRPQTNRAPEAPPTVAQADASLVRVLPVSAPQAVATDIGVSREGFGISTSDGEYLPIVKVAPIYPRSALAQLFTGECLVRYTVTAAGTVKDVEVLENFCTDPVFHAASIEAAKRFKYKPRIVDGEAIEVRGVLNNFVFDIQEPETQEP